MSWWPFGKKSSGIELSPEVQRIFEKLVRFLDDESAQNNALPEDFRRAVMRNPACDQIANGFGEFGRALTNPVPVNGPVGQLLYLSRLETVDGVPVAFHRLGAHESVDIFEIVSEDGRHWDLLYLSLYYPQKSRVIPARYRKPIDQRRASLIRGTTVLVDGFPTGIFQAALDCTKRIVGVSIGDPQLKAFERSHFVRPERHLAALHQLKFSSRQQ